MSLGVLEWTESGVLEVALTSLGTRSPSSAIATKSTTAVASQILKAADANTQIHKYTNTQIHKCPNNTFCRPGSQIRLLAIATKSCSIKDLEI